MEANNNIFKEYCNKCGYELEVSTNSNRLYKDWKVYFCRGACADLWNE